MWKFSAAFVQMISVPVILLSILLSMLQNQFPTQVQAHTIALPITGGMGGAGRAAIDPSEIAILNPASLAHLRHRGYFISGNYGFGEHPVDGQFTQYGVLVADGGVMLASGEPSSFLPGAFSYMRKRVDVAGEPTVTLQDFQVTLAGFLMNKVALGISGHRLIDQRTVSLDFTQDNAHVGLLINPFESFGFAMTAYDIWPAKDSVPIGTRVVPTFALGTHLVVQEMLRFRLDLVRPDVDTGLQKGSRRTNVMAGMESYFRPDFAIRLGGQWRETADQMYITAGLGFKGPRLSFDYAFQRDVRTAEAFSHLFDMWLPF